MKIFISYRRAEDKNTLFVISIHKLLAGAFGVENVFYDKNDIHGGNNWRDVLDNALNECTVMLVVIGPAWANLTNPDGTKRLFDPNDVTRWEVETGLKRSEQKKAVVIPVLVQNAGIPNSNDLPDELKSLVDRNVVQLRDSDFDYDMEKLIDDIRLSQGYREDDITTDYFEPKTIRIGKGAFWMGGSKGEGIPGNETPQEVLLPAYRIGKYPVTNAQYEEFVRDTNRSAAAEMEWNGQTVPTGAEKLPAMAVTWYDALAYCQWLSAKTGRKYSIPNEVQWEKACRGDDRRIYPWGNEFDPQRCNHGRAQIALVDAYPAQNEYGCCDLVGNVRQWTCTLWGEKRIAPDPKYADPSKDSRNDLNASRQIMRVVKGGSFKDDLKYMQCSARSGQAPDYVGSPGMRHSFRVVMSV